MNPVNILLVSELPLLRRGMTIYLQEQKAAKHVFQAESIAEASALLKQEPIDVAAIELDLLKPSGLGVIRVLLRSTRQLRIIVLSRGEIEPFVTQCMDRGVLGFLCLDSQPEEFLRAVHTVARFNQYLSRDAASAYALARLNHKHHPLSVLSRREYEVFVGLAQGTTVNGIAAALCLSNKTIHAHRASVFAKLSVSSAFELTLLAIKYGVMSVDRA